MLTRKGKEGDCGKWKSSFLVKPDTPQKRRSTSVARQQFRA